MFLVMMLMDVFLLVKKYMRNFEVVIVSRDEFVLGEVEQEYIEVVFYRRFDFFIKIFLDEFNEFYGIVFCQIKVEMREFFMRFRVVGFRVEVFNGDMSQLVREKMFNCFKVRKIKIFVVIDVVVRGFDVLEIIYVINYLILMNFEQYIYRIGRIGRMGKKGKVIIFIVLGELRCFRYIIKQVGVEVKKFEFSEGIFKEYWERLRQEEFEGEYCGRWGLMKFCQRRRRY